MTTFSAACGADGPLLLDVEGPGGSSRRRHGFDQPALLVGRGEGADLRLDHDDVGRRHAYLQVIRGRLFCIDLDSRTGTAPAGTAAAAGWVEPGRPIGIGPYRLWPHASVAGEGEEVEASPLSRRFEWPAPCPAATLHVTGQGGSREEVPLRRTLTLVGRSARCRVRFSSPGTSRFYGALLRTPSGVWVVDLRSTEGIAVNGVAVSHARLREGDELQIGGRPARLSYASTPAPAPAPRRTDLAAADLRPILEQFATIQQQTNDHFNQVMLMVSQMFGTMHREMVDLVREELDQIRRLAEDMQAAQARASFGPADPPADPLRLALTPPHDEPADPLRDPAEIHAIVSERLAAYERERQGRWNKISSLLTSHKR